MLTIGFLLFTERFIVQAAYEIMHGSNFKTLMRVVVSLDNDTTDFSLDEAVVLL